MVPQGSLRYWWEAHKNRVNSLAFSPDGKLLVSGGVDRTVKLWRVPETSLVRSFSER
jgi:WD40 repeat protein